MRARWYDWSKGRSASEARDLYRFAGIADTDVEHGHIWSCCPAWHARLSPLHVRARATRILRLLRARRRDDPGAQRTQPLTAGGARLLELAHTIADGCEKRERERDKAMRGRGSDGL